ncbi:MAG: TetR/AcrR family transcriptional regulator [Rhodocyclaceae bacterium]|nr:MAG: TetR/AcrR family transcriptional regulator [Rhodocyclaceae bacterium]
MATQQATPTATVQDSEAAILELARNEPELGQAAVARRLQEQGYRISPSGVRYIWQKHDLETTVKRLNALAADSAEGVEALTDSQRELLERNSVTARLLHPGGNDGTATDEPLERSEIIINAAAELFSTAGYDRTSIRDIASRVGLLPGSIYHHFPSKEELYIAVHREGFRRVLKRAKAAGQGITDPWERLRRACEVHVHGMTDGSPVDRITGTNLALIGNESLQARIQPFRDEYELVFRELIDALPLRPGVDPSLLRLTLLGSMNWVYLWYRPGQRTPAQIASAMLDMIRDGVAPLAPQDGPEHAGPEITHGGHV